MEGFKQAAGIVRNHMQRISSKVKEATGYESVDPDKDGKYELQKVPDVEIDRASGK